MGVGVGDLLDNAVSPPNAKESTGFEIEFPLMETPFCSKLDAKLLGNPAPVTKSETRPASCKLAMRTVANTSSPIPSRRFTATMARTVTNKKSTCSVSAIARAYLSANRLNSSRATPSSLKVMVNNTAGEADAVGISVVRTSEGDFVGVEESVGDGVGKILGEVVS